MRTEVVNTFLVCQICRNPEILRIMQEFYRRVSVVGLPRRFMRGDSGFSLPEG